MCELLQLNRELRSAAPTLGGMIWLHSENGLFLNNRYFFDQLKDLTCERPEACVDWRQDGDGLVASLLAEQHAYFVSLFAPDEGMHYSDNWVDLFPSRLPTSASSTRVASANHQMTWRCAGGDVSPRSLAPLALPEGAR